MNSGLYSLFFYKQAAYHDSSGLFQGRLFHQDDLWADEADLPGAHGRDLAQGDDFFGGPEERDPVSLLRREAAKRNRLPLANLPGFERGQPQALEGEGDLREGDRVRRTETLLGGHPFKGFEGHGA